jgi:hypothetical protein
MQTSPQSPISVRSLNKPLFFSIFFALFGSLLVFGIFLVVLYYKCIRTGRIRLGLGLRPGQYDDEQRLLLEEEEAMDLMDTEQQENYYAAKGKPSFPFRAFFKI